MSQLQKGGSFLSASRYHLLTILISACLTKIKDFTLMIEAVKHDLTDIQQWGGIKMTAGTVRIQLTVCLHNQWHLISVQGPTS